MARAVFAEQISALAEAGVMCVMAIADTAKFDLERLKRRVF